MSRAPQTETHAVIGPNESYGSVTQTVSGIVFEPLRTGWVFASPSRG